MKNIDIGTLNIDAIKKFSKLYVSLDDIQNIIYRLDKKYCDELRKTHLHSNADISGYAFDQVHQILQRIKNTGNKY